MLKKLIKKIYYTIFTASLIIIAIVMMTGCELPPDYNQDDYDYIDGNTELKVKIDSSLDGQYVKIDMLFFTRAWSQTQACTGLSAYPAPYVVVMKEILGAAAGMFWHDTKIIEIEYRYLYTFDILKHEMIHYLLDVNGMSGNRDHTSPFFKECSPNSTWN